MKLLPPPEERARRRAERQARTRHVAVRQIYLPMAAGIVVMAALAVLLYLLPGKASDNIVIVVLLLCPMSMALMVIYVAVVLLAMGVAKGHHYSATGLDWLNDVADQVRDVTRQTAGVVNDASVKINTSFAPASHVMKSVYDPKASDSAGEKPETDGHDDTTNTRK